MIHVNDNGGRSFATLDECFDHLVALDTCVAFLIRRMAGKGWRIIARRCLP